MAYEDWDWSADNSSPDEFTCPKCKQRNNYTWRDFGIGSYYEGPTKAKECNNCGTTWGSAY